MTPTAQERRLFPRIKLKIPLRYQVRGTPLYNNAVCENISLGGLGFINDDFIAPNTAVAFELGILSKFLRPFGRIVWSSPLPHSDRYRIGVEFAELDPIEKNYLLDYIDMQLGKL